MNLPMVLEIFSRRAYESLDEVCQDLLLSTKETMVDVNQLLYELDTAFKERKEVDANEKHSVNSYPMIV